MTNNISTPIYDFVKAYAKKDESRLHMPGHKGQSFLGIEQFDITEVTGADSLYEADGIIKESEENATALFGTKSTCYATGGSSQCIGAMLYLALIAHKQNANKNGVDNRPVVIATRNVHKSFIHAATLLDFDVVWLWPEKQSDSVCSCEVSSIQVEKTLEDNKGRVMAVYLTSPDYLGGMQDVRAIADVCHKYHTILAVDNAHGAYLRFLEPSKHPLDLGADICCDSAHKTLPVLTGGAYLHIGKSVCEHFLKQAKQAMALFGSTSPSYLTMMSLDLCNSYLSEDYKELLEQTVMRVEQLKVDLQKNGWQVVVTEPLKLTVCMPSRLTGSNMAEQLRKNNIECEYADTEYIVCMFTPENLEKDYERVLHALGQNQEAYTESKALKIPNCIRTISIREAMFASQKTVSVKEALGCICGAPTVSCPPAIPIVVAGEVIDKDAMRLFQYYGIDSVDVVEGRKRIG